MYDTVDFSGDQFDHPGYGFVHFKQIQGQFWRNNVKLCTFFTPYI
jgi:hypothetical protein